LAEEVGRDYDPFDLVCHVAYGQPPMTRSERAKAIRAGNHFEHRGPIARAALEALLDRYAREGLVGLQDVSVLRTSPVDRVGTPVEILRDFGGRESFLAAVSDMTNRLYRREQDPA
jgi:type I restriction enzyme R subunit